MSLDETKKEIDNFHVSIDIDKKNRNIVIRDNGYGIDTFLQFKKKMLSLGSSSKEVDKTKYIGFRGIGRLSGLPFCENLIFRNKAQNSDKISICTWEWETYRQLLNEDESKGDFQSIVNKIVTVKEEKINGVNTNEHFFEVIIENYSEEIHNILENDKFEEKLTRMLPLRYPGEFTEADKIIEKYNSFMNDNLERFRVSVKCNKKDLVKVYNKNY